METLANSLKRRSSPVSPRLAWLLLLGLLAARAWAEPVHCTAVHDGDTITCLISGRATHVRLQGIDAPELTQPYGEEARKFLSGLVEGRDVQLDIQGHDRYRRTVAVVLVGGRNANQALVRAGLAWWYRKYAPGDHDLERLEAEARSAHRGLWGDPAPVAPWDFRHPRSP